jgi:ubiquinone/menaquinone biosynthesis C-methylase UbiE
VSEEPDDQRARMREAWERVSAGWARQAESLRRSAMPVSAWMVEHAGLHPGQRVLELAAGPGDTGFMAAELISPGGVLITSDGAEAMVEVARHRAEELGVEGVEFRQLELEWIDLPTADVDVILCRWALMLTVDPATAVAECRRVLKPGGRLAVAVWDVPERNPDMSIPGGVLVSLGLAEPPSSGGPGPFSLSGPGALGELLQDGGFVDPLVERVDIQLEYASVREWTGKMVDLSNQFRLVWQDLDGEKRQAVIDEVSRRVSEYTREDGTISFPGSCLVAVAEA